MKKVALLFVLAVLVPSVLLAFLAARTLRDQRFVLEHQQTLLYQGVTDALAKEVNDYLSEEQRRFGEIVESLETNSPAQLVAAGFDDRLRAAWPMAEIGFCVTLNGSLLCPSPAARPETQLFCTDNGGFFANRESAEVFLNEYGSKGFNNSNTRNSLYNQEPDLSAANGQNSNHPEITNASAPSLANWSKVQARKVAPLQQQMIPGPAKDVPASDQNASKLVATEAEFRQLIGDATEGMLARFLQNKMRLMFWHRLARDPQLVFGAQLNLNRITAQLRAIVAGHSEPLDSSPRYQFQSAVKASQESSEVNLAILDDNARPVAVTLTNVPPNWKRPFVATEIGEALPHWEVAAYLRDPMKIGRTAQTIKLTMGLLIALLLIAMVVGSWLIVNDLDRQMKLARQKTDFVSNVSHELKTPLTSIRMFAELLAEDRVAEREKQKSYLNIITAEAARLTRLINNVLDFSRLERGEKKYLSAPLDLTAMVNETVRMYRPHLEAGGFHLESQIMSDPIQVRGDRDALAQVLVNLLSNAEKYSNGEKEITVELPRPPAESQTVLVHVLDRGPGVPRGLEERIFEQFYRVPDSLSSGIQGSGLGLTLARQIARAHGGEVSYAARHGGGSCFTLSLPVLRAAPDVPVKQT